MLHSAEAHTPDACSKGGGFFGRRERGLPPLERSGMLAVEDPTEPSNDLAKGSFNAHKACAAAGQPENGLVLGPASGFFWPCNMLMGAWGSVLRCAAGAA
jgi:hypothetical protein